MAKEAKAQANVPATTAKNTALPDFLQDQVKADAGKGTSQLQDDNIVPLIYVLQTNSPQVNRRGDAYIEGAEGGDFWLRNAGQPVIKGEAGMVFQPAYFYKELVEWVPRDDGGGFVGRHHYDLMQVDEKGKRKFTGDLADVKEVPDEKNPKRVHFMRENGNEIIETRYHCGFVHLDKQRLPFVMAFKSTGHTTSRNWMFLLNSKQTPDGKPMPSWVNLFRLKTVHKKNNEGEWFAVTVDWDGFITTKEDYEAGKAFHDAFASGAKVAADEEVVAGGEGRSGADKDGAM